VHWDVVGIVRFLLHALRTHAVEGVIKKPGFAVKEEKGDHFCIVCELVEWYGS